MIKRTMESSERNKVYEKEIIQFEWCVGEEQVRLITAQNRGKSNTHTHTHTHTHTQWFSPSFL